MPFTPLNPQQPTTVTTTVVGECWHCSEPAQRGDLCRYHYLEQAVSGRTKRWVPWYRRPGQWVPPLLAVLTAVAAFTFVPFGAAVFLLALPMFMCGFVFGLGQPKR